MSWSGTRSSLRAGTHWIMKGCSDTSFLYWCRSLRARHHGRHTTGRKYFTALLYNRNGIGRDDGGTDGLHARHYHSPQLCCVGCKIPMVHLSFGNYRRSSARTAYVAAVSQNLVGNNTEPSVHTLRSGPGLKSAAHVITLVSKDKNLFLPIK